MSNGWGGRRTGSGKKPSPLKSAKIAADLIERCRKTGEPGKFPHPLEMALAIVWDESEDKAVRRDMLKTILPYFAPRLQSVTVANPDDNRLTITVRDLSRHLSTADVIERAALSNGEAVIKDGDSIQVIETRTEPHLDQLLSILAEDDEDEAD